MRLIKFGILLYLGVGIHLSNLTLADPSFFVVKIKKTNFQYLCLLLIQNMIQISSRTCLGIFSEDIVEFSSQTSEIKQKTMLKLFHIHGSCPQIHNKFKKQKEILVGRKSHTKKKIFLMEKKSLSIMWINLFELTACA